MKTTGKDRICHGPLGVSGDSVVTDEAEGKSLTFYETNVIGEP